MGVRVILLRVVNVGGAGTRNLAEDCGLATMRALGGMIAGLPEH